MTICLCLMEVCVCVHFLSFKMQPFKVDKKPAEVVGSRCRQGVPETLLQFAVGLRVFVPTRLPLPVYRSLEHVCPI